MIYLTLISPLANLFSPMLVNLGGGSYYLFGTSTSTRIVALGGARRSRRRRGVNLLITRTTREREKRLRLALFARTVAGLGGNIIIIHRNRIQLGTHRAARPRLTPYGHLGLHSRNVVRCSIGILLGEKYLQAFGSIHHGYSAMRSQASRPGKKLITMGTVKFDRCDQNRDARASCLRARARSRSRTTRSIILALFHG
jgi:hypothetical protein